MIAEDQRNLGEALLRTAHKTERPALWDAVTDFVDAYDSLSREIEQTVEIYGDEIRQPLTEDESRWLHHARSQALLRHKEREERATDRQETSG